MSKRAKLPAGLYRRKRRDGTELPELWCYYYVRGRREPVQERTGSEDVEEALRFLYARKAEHPTARAVRIATANVTTSDALLLYEDDAKDHGRTIKQEHVCILRHRFGAMRLRDLTRADLDEACRVWRSVGADYPERDKKRNRLRPVKGATCNRYIATLKRARTLAMDKLSADLPRLTFPHFAEESAGRYVSPEELHAILPHVVDPVKGAFLELLYLLAIRPGQLKSTETSNVRVEKGRPVALVYRPAQVKQRVPHEVPLVGRAQDVVAELLRRRRQPKKAPVATVSRLLFHVNGKPLRELKSEWGRACKAAGIVSGRKAGGVVLYNLRHSSLTNLAAAGVPDTTARAISGHKTDSAHRRYVITQEAAKIEALAAMTALVEQVR